MTNKQIIKLSVGIVLGLFAIILLSSTFGTVKAGHKGVVLQFGGVTGEIKNEGLYVKTPFIQKIVKFNVQEQKEEVSAASASLDLQNVSTTVAVNFYVKPEVVAELYKTVGVKYKDVLISPAIQEVVKSSSSKYTAEQLITKREIVREEIKSGLISKLNDKGIIVRDVNIVNFNFSKSFDEAIEAKVTAEQNALAAKNKLEQIKFEAEQAIAEAKGKAEALEIEGKALSENPQVKELRAIERWNGVMPQVVGDAVPFINIR